MLTSSFRASAVNLFFNSYIISDCLMLKFLLSILFQLFGMKKNTIASKPWKVTRFISHVYLSYKTKESCSNPTPKIEIRGQRPCHFLPAREVHPNILHQRSSWLLGQSFDIKRIANSLCSFTKPLNRTKFLQRAKQNFQV